MCSRSFGYPALTASPAVGVSASVEELRDGTHCSRVLQRGAPAHDTGRGLSQEDPEGLLRHTGGFQSLEPNAAFRLREHNHPWGVWAGQAANPWEGVVCRRGQRPRPSHLGLRGPGVSPGARLALKNMVLPPPHPPQTPNTSARVAGNLTITP